MLLEHPPLVCPKHGFGYVSFSVIWLNVVIREGEALKSTEPRCFRIFQKNLLLFTVFIIGLRSTLWFSFRKQNNTKIGDNELNKTENKNSRSK